MSLTDTGCRARQKRLLDVMARERLDLVIVVQPQHVAWLTGRRFDPLKQAVATLAADGHCTLVAPDRPVEAAADEVLVFASHRHCTLRNDQQQAACEAYLAARTDRPLPRRIGVEFSSAPAHITTAGASEIVDIEPALYRLRRRKEADELHCLRRAIAACGAMYARAREIIAPGVDEFAVFGELHTAAVRVTGETGTYVGNDFQCGTPGGPPRQRAAQDGELFILDLSPSYRGYHADTCRAVAVNRQPTAEQLQAWHTIVGVLRHIESAVKPGVSCRAIFDAAQGMLDKYRAGSFNHHLGHGIGLFPHEGPHLNPHWDEVFEEGDVFTAEPGLYGPELRGGIRIENDYLVTATGVELLSKFPEEL